MTSWIPDGINLDDALPGSIEELLGSLRHFTLDEVRQDPRVRAHLCRALARHSPAGLALVASRGRWQLARHHSVMNREILKACQQKEGRLILSVTVRAGKSVLGARFASAWHLGTRPDENVILGAHEAGFSAEHSGFARDVLAEYGPALYGVTVSGSSSARNRWQIAGHAGGMMSVGVGGSPIGRGGHLMVIDDPYKSYEAAMSERQRERVNETWFQGTMSSRLEPGGTIIIICSRWHEEDLSGYLKANYPADWTEVYIPALRTDDDQADLLGRAIGESFWPERWPAELLERRQREVGPVVWLAQYQQRPTAPTGGMFPVGKIGVVHPAATSNPDDPVLDLTKIRSLCRGWDLAATEGDGDYTVGVLLGRYHDGRWVIIDVVRGQWGEARVRQTIEETTALDRAKYGSGVLVELPQDPGQAGKAQASQLGAMLSGALVEARIQSGAKETRAAGVAAQWQLGNVDMVIVDVGMDGTPLEPARAEANRALLDEARVFPKGAHDDTIDALAAAFNRLASAVVVEQPFEAGAAFAAVGATRSNELR